jgi:hypothetical protein
MDPNTTDELQDRLDAEAYERDAAKTEEELHAELAARIRDQETDP